MDQLDAIQSAAALLLEKAQNASVSELASAVEKASDALRLSADLEKSRAELQKLALEESKLRNEIDTATKREHSDTIKEYVSILAPFITVISLVATLIWQSWQFRQSEKDKSNAAEDAQWADAIKTISQTGNLSPGVIALNPFLKSPRYHNAARDEAVQLLASSDDPILFTDLFGAAFVPVGWNDLDGVLKLDRALYARGQPLLIKEYDPKTDTSDLTKLTPKENQTFNYIGGAMSVMCSQVGSVLRSPGRKGASLDFRSTGFTGCNWSTADLSGANIEGMYMWAMNLKDADLSGINQFEGADFSAVAWWEAKSISPELLQYLENHPISKYKEGQKYGLYHNETVTPQEYAAGLKRLRQRQ